MISIKRCFICICIDRLMIYYLENSKEKFKSSALKILIATFLFKTLIFLIFNLFYRYF